MRSLLRRLGIEVTRAPAPHTLEWNLAQLLKHRNVDLVIDVGAHHGQFASSIRHLGYTGRIISFEPSKAAFGVISQKMSGDPAWRGEQSAVGSAPGMLELNVYQSTDFNSARMPTSLGVERFSLRPTASQAVRMVALDDVVQDGRGILLKTDTQGFDLDVLQGAEQVLRSTLAVVIELSVRPIYEEAPTLSTVVTYLEKAGFVLQALVPVSRNTGFDVVEFDGLFLRA